MSWKVNYTPDALKSLARMPRNESARIVEKVKQLAKNPHAPNNNVKALKGKSDACRLRVGDWRVIYTLRDSELVILVLTVGPRGSVYD